MQCKNGYTKPGVKGILCRKAKEPKDNDMRSTAHALCGHQRFCPNARCYTLLPGWEKCVLRENTAAAQETREEAAGREIETQEGKPKGKKKTAKKSAESAEQKGE